MRYVSVHVPNRLYTHLRTFKRIFYVDFITPASGILPIYMSVGEQPVAFHVTAENRIK